MKAPGRPTDGEILRRRAELLARPRPAATDRLQPDRTRALDFSIAGQRCLLELPWVREVRAFGELLPVPLAPPPLLGLVQLRGRLLAVLDLRALLGIADDGRGPSGLVLVIGRDAPELGIAVGQVHGLQPVSPAGAARRSQPLQVLRPELVRGVTPAGHLLLDGGRLLALQGAPSPEPARPPEQYQRHDRP